MSKDEEEMKLERRTLLLKLMGMREKYKIGTTIDLAGIHMTLVEIFGENMLFIRMRFRYYNQVTGLFCNEDMSVELFESLLEKK